MKDALLIYDVPDSWQAPRPPAPDGGKLQTQSIAPHGAGGQGAGSRSR